MFCSAAVVPIPSKLTISPVCYRFVYLTLVSLDKIENLAQQISSLQIEKKKIEEEFGVQRAKMKELFLQKESESMCASKR